MVYSISSVDNEINIEEYNILTDILELSNTVKIPEPCRLKQSFTTFSPKIDKINTLAICDNSRVYFYNSQNASSWYREEGLSNVLFSEIVSFEAQKDINKEVHLNSVEEVFSKSILNTQLLNGFFQMLKTDLVEIYNRVKNNIEVLIDNKNVGISLEKEWKVLLVVFTSNRNLYIFDSYDGTMLYKQ